MGDARRRATIKSSIERLSAYTEDAGFEQATIEELDVRIDRLTTLFKNFEDEHLEIVSATVDDDQEAIDLNEDKPNKWKMHIC